MNVQLDAATERLIAAELGAGRASSPEDLIHRALLHFLQAREFGEVYSPDEIEQKIARGRSSLQRGEGVDGEVFLDRLDLELDSMEKASKLERVLRQRL